MHSSCSTPSATRSSTIYPDVGSGQRFTAEFAAVPKVQFVRFCGRVEISTKRVARETSLIVEEVIKWLTSQVNADAEITLEIRARKPDGFDDQAMRTVSENSRTLRFDHFGFEEG